MPPSVIEVFIRGNLYWHPTGSYVLFLILALKSYRGSVSSLAEISRLLQLFMPSADFFASHAKLIFPLYLNGWFSKRNRIEVFLWWWQGLCCVCLPESVPPHSTSFSSFFKNPDMDFCPHCNQMRPAFPLLSSYSDL